MFAPRSLQVTATALIIVVSCSAQARRRTTRPAEQPAARVLPQWSQQPDPPPLQTAQYLDLTVELQRGLIRVLGVSKGTFAEGITRLPRFRGRYVAKLYARDGLCDVLRFDFPLTAVTAVSSSREQRDRDTARGVTARLTLRVPYEPRIVRLQIYDSLTRAVYPVDLSRLGSAAASPPRTLPRK